MRWTHVVAGIAWIGSSFYFIALDASLQSHPRLDPRVKGEAWQVHGGGFYQMQKFVVAPDYLPARPDLVQVGSILDLDLRLSAAGAGLLPQPDGLSDRPLGLAIHPVRRGGGRRRVAGGGLGGLRPALQVLDRAGHAAAGRGRLRAAGGWRRSATRTCSPGAARSSMSARWSARSWWATYSSSSFRTRTSSCAT